MHIRIIVPECGAARSRGRTEQTPKRVSWLDGFYAERGERPTDLGFGPDDTCIVENLLHGAKQWAKIDGGEESVSYEAVHVGTGPATDEKLLLGLKWAVDRAGSWERVTVVAPTKDYFRSHSILRTLPTSVRKESFATVRPWHQLTPVVVACWPDQKTLDRLDGCEIEALCVIPWAPGEIDIWRAARNAIDITGGPQATPIALDPVVEAALQSLTERVNLSTGLGHPSDRSSAISMFKILKRAGYSWEPDAVKIWAIQNGWKADHAADLADKAEGVLEGRRYQNVTDMWATDILAQWSTEAD